MFLGLSHLEALTILSTRSAAKVDSFLSDNPRRKELVKSQKAIKERFSRTESDDEDEDNGDEKRLTKNLQGLLAEDGLVVVRFLFFLCCFPVGSYKDAVGGASYELFYTSI